MSRVVVSVIMLTYNRERYLPESIASVLSQTFQELELIIIDDGSTDESQLMIQSIDDSRIRYFKFDHTGWASRLRNFAFGEAKGKFLAFIDSDDIWLSEKLQRQVHQMNRDTEIGFTFTDVVIFKNENTILKASLYKKLWKDSFKGRVFDLYVQSKFVIYPSSFLFDKRCLSTTDKLNELFPWTDNDFFHRLAFQYKAFYLNEPLVRIRKHKSNNSEKPGQETVDEMVHMLNIFYKQSMISEQVYHKMIAHYHYLSGILHLRTDHYAEATKAFVNCTHYTPLNIKAWVRRFLSLLHIPQHS